jgi:hypothetical protein
LAEDNVEILVRSNDVILLHRLTSLLEGEGIAVFHLDRQMSVLEGSVGALPQRLCVADADAERARRLIGDIGLGHVLTKERPA